MAVEERSNLEDVLANYIDRLNSGERIGREEILAENPVHGPEIVEHLEGFIEWTVDKAPDPPLGTLGDYTLRRQLGRGGMGVVYEAWQNSMDRIVALKVLPPGIAADNRAFLRFMREAKTAGHLNHQNVVTVYSSGVEEGTPWYSMEYVEGETLAQIVAKMRAAALDASTVFGGTRAELAYYSNVAKAFADASDGLQHAHSRGVIHRDIKPSNLILDTGATSRNGGGEDSSPMAADRTPETSPARLRILDFGLARLEGQESLSASGDVVGTPLYMSPEQARRKKIAVDHRTDIYSLGATLYEVLTLEPPFRGKDHEDTLSQIVTRDPEPPRQLNPHVPRDLETIVLKCLRKDPGDRYGTAEALGQDLRRFIRGDPIEARPKPGWEKWLAFLVQNRVRIILIVAVGGLILAGGALGLITWREIQGARWAEYVQVLNRALVDLEFGLVSAPGQPLEGETVSLGLYFPEDVQGEHILNLLPETLSALDGAALLFPQRPEAHVLRWRVLWALGEVEAASQALDHALAADPGNVPAALLRLEELRFQGRKTEMQQDLRDLDRRTTDGWRREYLDAHLVALRNKWNELDAMYTRLLGENLEEPFVGYQTDLRLKRARLALLRGNHLSAVEDFAYLRDTSRSLGPALLLAGTYYRMGQREAARRTLDAALSAHPSTPASLGGYAICDSLGDREKARQIIAGLSDEGARQAALQSFYYRSWKLEEALEAGKKAIALGAGSAGVYVDQLWICLDLQRPLDARAYGEEAIAKIAKHPHRKHLLAELGWVYDYMAETDTAIRLFEQAVPLERAYMGLGWCQFRKGDLDSSDRYLQESILRYPRSAAVYFGFARNCMFRGDTKGAIANMVQCNLISPGFEIDLFLSIYSPQRANLFSPHWENLGSALERASESGDERPGIQGLSALCHLHKGDRDIARALDHAQQAVEKTCGLNGRYLAIQAEIQTEAGKTEEAIRSLEKAAELHDRPGFASELLQKYRRQVYPRIVSEASVDALLAGDLDLPLPAGELSTSSPELARYLEACTLQSAGELERAAEILEGLVSTGPITECLVLRLAGLWGGLGRREEALRFIEDQLLGTGRATVKAWSAWVELASSEPALAVDDLVERSQGDAGEPSGEQKPCRRLTEDVRWLLGEFSTAGEIRISCGRESDHVDRSGRIWSRDRFFEGGQGPGRYTAAIQNSDDWELYQKRRWWRSDPDAFMTPGYRIPLPCGRYAIVMHFCKTNVFPPQREKRLFDVVVEGSVLLEGFDPAGGAVGVVEEKRFEVEVQDGCLDLVFRSVHPWAAFISAIELRRQI